MFQRGQRVRVRVDGLPDFATVRYPIPHDETGEVDLAGIWASRPRETQERYIASATPRDGTGGHRQTGTAVAPPMNGESSV